MQVAKMMGTVARRLDRRFGIQALLAGEPRPPAGGFDVRGEKLLDWGFICSSLPKGPRRALEIGSGQSPIIPAMLALGYDVTAVDLCAGATRVLSGFHFLAGDFLQLDLRPGFDVIVVCSVVEHMGLAGRYGSREDPDGDLKAMRKIAGLLAANGQVFLTVPVGMDAIWKPWHRVYGRVRLPLLIEEFDIVTCRFLVKPEPWGPWRESAADAALDHPADARGYALGEMILRSQQYTGWDAPRGTVRRTEV